jgi:Ala-tRNA(Pro) deacylase
MSRADAPAILGDRIMSLAHRVHWYLDHHHIDYQVIHHDRSKTSLESSLRAHVPPGRVAKSVLLEDERGYVLAVVPAACRLSFEAIDQVLERNLELATERELEQIFSDCERGAVPALGAAYNIPMVVDNSLLRLPDVYFEGGDHQELVHVESEAFRELMKRARHGRISRPH